MGCSISGDARRRRRTRAVEERNERTKNSVYCSRMQNAWSRRDGLIICY